MGKLRINLILVLIFLFGAAIISRLVFLQISQHDFYSALARGQQKFFIDAQGERGQIFFQNHDFPVATNKNYYFVYASPSGIPQEEKENTAEVLSQVLDLDKESISIKFQKDSLYELLKDRLTEKEALGLKEKQLTGVYLGEEKLRNYPYGELASHILGFVNKDGQGQYGVEEYWNDLLAGKENILEGERGLLGYFFTNSKAVQANGANLELTIDYNIQYFAEKLLNNAQKNLDIGGGTIVVMNPNSGEILALADSSNFDPNKYYQENDLRVFQTDAIQKIFEPGSVFKPITMSGAINEGSVTPYTTYRDPGVVEIGGWPIYNYDQRSYPGDITMTGVLERSINTGAVFAESQLGNQKFSDYIKKFGIFEKTGIDLAGEILSLNKEFKKGYDIGFATASFGQGIEMTPIQLVRAFSSISNGGKLVKPYLVKKIKNNGNMTEIRPEIIESGVISPATASKVTAMLVSVVENGFGKAAKIPGYYIAGKTGTAQVSFSSIGINQSGYSERTWQSFIGFAPAFDPKFIILVKLNNPATKTAEYSAVPIFKDLAKYIIDYWQIPPDYEP
ncbi:MAG: penicillin-binding protein 2 [Candidatus Nealsonbacteria bacterium]|nr:penicillin-binding protein 2 [Candidatus Nealsonbacteria bacterium]